MYTHKSFPSLIPREVIFGEPLNSNPKISPDGKKIAYISPVNNIKKLWIKDLHDGNSGSIASFEKAVYISYVWLSDKYIVYFQDLSGNEIWSLFSLNVETGEHRELIQSKNVNVIPISYNNRDFPNEIILAINKDSALYPDLYHFDIISEELTMVDKNPGNIFSWVIDNNLKPMGRVILDNDGICELMVREYNDNWKKIIEWNIEEQPVSRPLCFSKDNSYIYIIDAIHYNISRVVKIDVKTGQSYDVAFHPEYDIYTLSFREEKFKYDDDPLLVNPETGEIQAVTINKFRKEWIILDENIKEDFENVKNINNGDFRIINRDNKDEMWLIGFEKDDAPVSYYVYNRKTKDWKFLFYDNPLLNDYKLSSMEEVTFLSRDGLTIHGYITYPLGKERKKLPLVLYVHGGPWSRDVWGYDPTVQWFVSRGYACLQINYRGSIGYGKDFLNLGNKEWGGKIQNDLSDGVKWAIEKGIADPDKVAIYGSGFGGYAALAGAAFTPELFCCAIAIACPGNLITFIQSIIQQTSYWYVNRKRFLKRIGDPEIDKELLISRSPFYNPENIKIPLMISHGLKNQRVKSAETYEVIKHMRSKGLHVETVVFPDESYVIRKAKNRIKFYGMAEKFLSRYLGGIYEEIDSEHLYMTEGHNKDFNESHIINKILKEGDTRAFEDLMEHYKKPLFKYLFDLTGDPLLTIEIFHDTFSRIWLYLDSYSRDMPFHSWMFKIALNSLRKRKIKDASLLKETELGETELDMIIGSYEENIEDKIFVRSMVDSLREPYKTSLILRFTEDLELKEIASIMNVNVKQVKNYLFRAKKTLSKKLSPEKEF